MEFTLRDLGEADLPALTALYRQCADFIRLGTGAPIDAAMVRADLARAGVGRCGGAVRGGAGVA